MDNDELSAYTRVTINRQLLHTCFANNTVPLILADSFVSGITCFQGRMTWL